MDNEKINPTRKMYIGGFPNVETAYDFARGVRRLLQKGFPDSDQSWVHDNGKYVYIFCITVKEQKKVYNYFKKHGIVFKIDD